MTATCHGWRLPPLGAKRAMSSSSASSASDTGSSVNSRTAGLERNASIRSMAGS